MRISGPPPEPSNFGNVPLSDRKGSTAGPPSAVVQALENAYAQVKSNPGDYVSIAGNLESFISSAYPNIDWNNPNAPVSNFLTAGGWGFPSASSFVGALNQLAEGLGVPNWPPYIPTPNLSSILNQASGALGQLLNQTGFDVPWTQQKSNAIQTLTGYLNQLQPHDPGYSILASTISQLKNANSPQDVFKALEYGVVHFALLPPQ